MIHKSVVVRDDELWQGHPDVAFFRGRVFVVWRESDRHLTDGGTAIRITSGTVFDNNNCSYLAYIRTPETIISSPNRLNCPRLSVINDTLWMICDEIQGGGDFLGTELAERDTRVFLWKSHDGAKWHGPIQTNISGIVPDRICKFNDEYFIATHTGKTAGPTEFGFLMMSAPKNHVYLTQNIWKTSDLSSGHWEKHSLADDPDFLFCEASVVVTPENQLLCLMRENSQRGLPAYCSVSENGTSWTKPVPTRLFACHRPVTGFLKSGRLLTTYREASHVFAKRYWAKNTFAHLCDFDSFELSKGIILPLDHDHAENSDSGYTGWVQLPDDRILAVNYITDDATKPYIRSYIFSETDF